MGFSHGKNAYLATRGRAILGGDTMTPGPTPQQRQAMAWAVLGWAARTHATPVDVLTVCQALGLRP